MSSPVESPNSSYPYGVATSPLDSVTDSSSGAGDGIHVSLGGNSYHILADQKFLMSRSKLRNALPATPFRDIQFNWIHNANSSAIRSSSDMTFAEDHPDFKRTCGDVFAKTVWFSQNFAGGTASSGFFQLPAILVEHVRVENLRHALSFVQDYLNVVGGKIYFDTAYPSIWILAFKYGAEEDMYLMRDKLELAIRSSNFVMMKDQLRKKPSMMLAELVTVCEEFDRYAGRSIQDLFGSCYEPQSASMLDVSQASAFRAAANQLGSLCKPVTAIVQVMEHVSTAARVGRNGQAKLSELQNFADSFEPFGSQSKVVELPDACINTNDVTTYAVQFSNDASHETFVSMLETFTLGYTIQTTRGAFTFFGTFYDPELIGPPASAQHLPKTAVRGGWWMTVDLASLAISGNWKESFKVRRYIPAVPIPDVANRFSHVVNDKKSGNSKILVARDSCSDWGLLPSQLWALGTGMEESKRRFQQAAGKRTGPSQVIYPSRIIDSGSDVRTTVMLRNIPNRMTKAQVLDVLQDMMPRGSLDFFYLRIDFVNGSNVGYGFVNLVDPELVAMFVLKMRGFRWPNSDKIADVSYATIQGRETLIQKFRNSNVMEQPEHYRPMLLYSRYGGSPQSKWGTEEPFPTPDNGMQLRRSIQNAAQEGLWAGSFNHPQGNHQTTRHRGFSFQQPANQNGQGPPRRARLMGSVDQRSTASAFTRDGQQGSLHLQGSHNPFSSIPALQASSRLQDRFNQMALNPQVSIQSGQQHQTGVQGLASLPSEGHQQHSQAPIQDGQRLEAHLQSPVDVTVEGRHQQPRFIWNDSQGGNIFFTDSEE